MTSRPRSARPALAGLVAIAVLSLLAWWAAASVSPPDAARIGDEASGFSAERARVHQADASRRPHPAGSAEAAVVRGGILKELRASAIDARVQSAVGSSGDTEYPAAAHVENVVGKIPGSDPSGTVLLVAHYDAAPASLGAGDDGAGVATLLEVGRALANDGTPKNDIVLLFTDAEEPGMFGAEAFVASDPDGRRGGVALNIESRGASGPAVMFETSSGNERLIDLFGANAPYPVATSLAGDLYRLLPNDTDLTPVLDSGRFTGLNSSYLDGSAVYHSPEDSIERQSIDTLQHQGSNALAVTRALADADLAELGEPAPGDATYFPLLGRLAHYPAALVWPIAAVAASIVLTAGVLLVRRGAATLRRLALGVLMAMPPLVISLGLGAGLWALMTGVQPAYAQLEEPWNPGWFRAGLVVAVIGVHLGWLALARRWDQGSSLFFGALVWTAVLALSAAAAVPGGSYVFALPALAGGLSLIATASVGAAGIRGRVRARWATVSTVAACSVAILILVPSVVLLLPVAGISGSGLALFLAALLLLLLTPVADLLFTAVSDRLRPAAFRRLVLPVGALVVASALVVAGFVVNANTRSHPIPVALAYVEDRDTGQAHWVSGDADPTGWSDRLVDRHEDLTGSFPMLEEGGRTGTAEPSGAPAPVVTVLSEGATDGDRELTVRFSSRSSARTLYLEPVRGAIRSITVEGRLVASGGVPSLQIEALREGEIEMTIRSEGAGPLELRLIEGADGLRELPGYVERPRDVVPAAGHIAEMRFLATTAKL